MNVARSNDRECLSAPCVMRRPGGICGFDHLVSPPELAKFARELTSADGRPPAESCPYWRRVLYPKLRRLRWEEPIDEAEALTDFFLLVERIVKARRGRPIPGAYLGRVLVHHTIDLRRERWGRMRCENCISFLASLHLCSNPLVAASGAIVDLELPDPRACGHYRSVRMVSESDPHHDPPDREVSLDCTKEDVHRALGRLANSHPGSAGLLKRVFLEGQNLRSLALDLGVDHRRVRRWLGRSMTRLARIVDDLP